MATTLGFNLAPARHDQDCFPHPDPPACIPRLTDREHQVLVMLRSRSTNREIAEHLSISVRTVESHVASILNKLGAANRRDSAAVATRLGIR